MFPFNDVIMERFDAIFLANKGFYYVCACACVSVCVHPAVADDKTTRLWTSVFEGAGEYQVRMIKIKLSDWNIYPGFTKAWFLIPRFVN